MKTKKIFFVADAKSIHTAKWVDYFVQEKYEVHLATFASINQTQCTNIYFLSNKKSSVYGKNYHYIFKIKALSELFKKIEPDVINAHYSYSMGLISLLAKRYANIEGELSVVCHGSDVLAPPKPYLFDKINRYILNQCDKVFVVSDQIKDKVESFGVDINKIFIGQYGLNVEKEDSIKDIDILSNRAYHSNSRIEFLLDCLDKLEHKGLNIVFVIPNIDDKSFDKLVKRYSYISFYKHVEYNKMLNLINRSKVYISATLSDGTALSLLEGMKLGCVPLVSNIVSNRSWVLDGVNGFLFDSSRDFILKLEKILGLDSSRLEEIYKINSMLLNEKATYSGQMKKIEEFLL